MAPPPTTRQLQQDIGALLQPQKSETKANEMQDPCICGSLLAGRINWEEYWRIVLIQPLNENIHQNPVKINMAPSKNRQSESGSSDPAKRMKSLHP